MQLARIIQLPDHLTSTEKLDFLQDVILYLHDQLEETESVPQQRAFGFIGTTSAIAITWSLCGMGMIAPVVAIPGAIIVAGCSLLTGITLAKDVIESPELVDLQKRLVTVLESKEVDQWVKLWEERGTESFLRSLQYACNGGFTAKGAFRHKSGSHPFDVAALFGGGKAVAPWEKQSRVISPQLLPPITPQQYSGSIESAPTQQIVGSTSMAFERPPAPPQSFTEVVEFKQEVPNLPLRLAQDMKNTLIAGVPGSGKGVFVSNALGYVIERGDTTVFYIDPKNDPKESGYFEGRVHKLFRLSGGIISAEPVFVYDWLQKCFTAFHSFDAGNGRKLLILDEMTSLVKKLANVPAKVTGTVKGDKWLEEEIVTCAAAGDSAGATLWGMAQNGHNSGLGMDGGAKSQMTPIAIISLKQLTASQALLRASFVPSDQRLSSEEIKRICEASEVGRAIFHGGLNCWYSMPVLPNPSGYNRDDRQFVEGFSPQVVTQQQPVTSSDYSEQDRTAAEAEAVIVAALRSTPFHTLWEFGRDELGLQSSEEIKRLLERVGEVIFDYDLTELKEKFRLRSKHDVRYSYAGYSKKVAATHRKTGNVCALCHQNQSEEAHHIEYLGIEDEPGKNLLPLCLPCHKEVAHSRENWQQLSIWKSRNTPEFEARLKLEYQFALVEGEAQ